MIDLEARMRAKDASARRQTADAAPMRSAASTPTSRNSKGDRWRAFNSFVDLIAPRLTLAERAVWIVLFRHARDGVTETTARVLATAAGIDKATAVRSVRTLHRVGLVWTVWKSTDRSKASKYAMHPKPAECLAKLPSRGGAK
jgi:hypothetical protein